MRKAGWNKFDEPIDFWKDEMSLEAGYDDLPFAGGTGELRCCARGIQCLYGCLDGNDLYGSAHVLYFCPAGTLLLSDSEKE